MEKNIEQALINIRIVIGNARMTDGEHTQLKNDINMIEKELKRIEEWTEEGTKPEKKKDK